MRRLWFALVLAAALAAPALAAKNKLNVYIWSEYIDPEIVAEFEKKFDCKVTLDFYEDPESMMAKLESGGVSLYDICVPTDYLIPAMVKRGLLAPLDLAKIPNMKNVEERFLNPPFDPGNKHTVPYQWGTLGLYIRKAGDKPVEETWGLLFDPAKQPGPFLLMDSMRDCFSGALKYKGYSLNTVDKEQLKEARDLMIEAKKRSVGFEGGVGGKNKVLAKGCVLAMVYNGDAIRGMGEDEETHYFVPREGSQIWVDTMALTAKAPNPEMAYAFIDHILDAEVGAQLSNFNQYATPNEASKKFINPDDLKNPAIYPTPEIMAKLEFLEDLGPKSRLFDEIWTQVKSK
jgi:spermidine/putrescine transport system substrate-binding protein